jgi:hypothetical protein
MNYIEAAKDCRSYVNSDEAKKVLSEEHPTTGINHLNYMIDEIVEGGQSEGKANRWLGYLQGVLVATGVATLSQMKDVNKRHV